jgi:hypothetical protein
MPYDYDAWLEDRQLPPDDEDFEWRAHVIVVADDEGAAQAWGDVLVKELCAESADVFLRSSVEPHVCDLTITPGSQHPCPNYPALSRPGNAAAGMPVVEFGERVTAEYIGW